MHIFVRYGTHCFTYFITYRSKGRLKQFYVAVRLAIYFRHFMTE